MNVSLWSPVLLLAGRMAGSSGSGLGLFVALLVLGVILFLVLRGRQDRAEQLGAPIRPMASGPLQGLAFPCPYPKCPACGAAGDKMKQAWDGARKVTWTCGYCGGVAGIQELKDEDLPRAQPGLDAPQAMVPGPGYGQPQGPDIGGLLTGVMLGEMLAGERRYPEGPGPWNDGGGDPTLRADGSGPSHAASGSSEV